jgi:hypothetical protein
MSVVFYCLKNTLHFFTVWCCFVHVCVFYGRLVYYFYCLDVSCLRNHFVELLRQFCVIFTSHLFHSIVIYTLQSQTHHN